VPSSPGYPHANNSPPSDPFSNLLLPPPPSTPLLLSFLSKACKLVGRRQLWKPMEGKPRPDPSDRKEGSPASKPRPRQDPDGADAGKKALHWKKRRARRARGRAEGPA
jgi:hypothetical protein